MIINVGSENPVKVEAVKKIVDEYDFLSGVEVRSYKVKSSVSEQPRDLEETARGAFNRARDSFQDCKYSFGIESGLIHVPYSNTGRMNVCICSIFDGKNDYFGMSSGFEYPHEVLHMVDSEELDINDAFNRLELTDDKRIGNSGGAIGLLTKGRLPRKEYTKQAIQMALIQLENSELYKSG